MLSVCVWMSVWMLIRSTQPRISPWVGVMSTSQREVMTCGLGVKAGMVREWVAGKTVWFPNIDGILTIGMVFSSAGWAFHTCHPPSTISVHLSVILNHTFSSQLSLPSHSVPAPPIRSSRFWRFINLVVCMYVGQNAVSVCVWMCLGVNQGGMYGNRCTQRLIILHAQTY